MKETPDKKVLQVINQIHELARVEGFLETLSEQWGFSARISMILNLVLEEALTNTILYGYDDSLEHTITLNFELEGDILSISIFDDGHEYDPTQKKDPDITLAAEDRQIGGLGIFLIKKNMDSVEYLRIENKNCLILKKNIKS